MANRLERLINLVIALRETRRPLTAAEIRTRVAGYGQDDVQAFRRMFERDKSDLRMLGVPVETAPLGPLDETQGYRIDPTRYDLPPTDLAPDELAALALAVSVTGLSDEARTGLRKLAVDAGEPGDAEPPAVPLAVELLAPQLDVLFAAQTSRTVVRFVYAPVSRPAEQRTVDPHGLVHRGGHWYLVGRDHARDERRAFRLDRVVGPVEQVGDGGAFPPVDATLSVDDVLPRRDGPASARVLASPDVAWLVARRARGGGEERDGWTAFSVALRDEEELVAWILELGQDVVVTDPPRVREAVVDALRRMAR